MEHFNKDTICALATVQGVSALSVIRLSGTDSIVIADKIFISEHSDTNLQNAKSHTLHYGIIKDNEDIIDDVVVSVYREPHSYTGENCIEISCHGSVYIQKKILELLIANGCRLANPGEFTLRAFMNKRIDLSQAEAVADLISSASKTSHSLAINQMRGGFSGKIKSLRSSLVEFKSLLELELDFSEEDVEFADRKKLKELTGTIESEVEKLIESFSTGNVIKQGIPVAIIGKPNSGKSTLLNAILNEEKAIVSEIPGTTRDAIEDVLTYDGIGFRFIDTAGLREAGDRIETFGIEKTYEKISQASVILYVFDITQTTAKTMLRELEELKERTGGKSKQVIVIANKIDLLVNAPRHFKELVEIETIFISAKRKENIKVLLDNLASSVKSGLTMHDTSIVSNIRHYEALSKSLSSLKSCKKGLEENISGELLAIDINDALYHLGSITGEVASQEILDNIFSNFCIGK